MGLGSGGSGWGNAVCGEIRQDLGFGQVETESFEGNFEFVVVYSLVFVQVEQCELYDFVSIGDISTLMQIRWVFG